MSTFSPAVSGPIVEAVQAGQSALSTALSEVFGVELAVAVGELQTVDDAHPGEWDKAGLAFHLTAAEGSVLWLLPTELKLLPNWCQSAETLENEKLLELA